MQAQETHEDRKVLPKGLAAAAAARIARAAAGETVVHRTPLEKLALQPSSLRLSINAKCYQCEGEDADPGVRRRIGTCSIRACGLWAVRPYQHMMLDAAGEEDTNDANNEA